jgi:hypothetical protein
MRTSKAIILTLVAVINLQFVAMMFSQPAQAVGQASGNFCAKLTTEQGIRMGKMKDSRYKLKDPADISRKDTKLASLRSEADAKRQNHFEELNKKYTTETQKQAIDTYKATIQNAVIQRREAIDKIRQDFRTKLAELSAEHQTKLRDAENELITAVGSAMNKATNACRSAESTDVIKAEFVASITSAKAKFVESKNSLGVGNSNVSKAVADRDSALDEAYKNFRVTAERARAELKAQLNAN